MPTMQQPSATSDSTLDLATALRHSVTRLARRLRQQDRTGLGPTVTAALASISRHGGTTHGELAALEQVSPPTITAVVAKLEALGLVSRETDEHDRRVTRILITPAGIAKLDDVRNRRTEWLQSRLRSLSALDRSKLAAAADVLVKLIEAPEAPEAPEAHEAGAR